jgi:hypothetical protein
METCPGLQARTSWGRSPLPCSQIPGSLLHLPRIPIEAESTNPQQHKQQATTLASCQLFFYSSSTEVDASDQSQPSSPVKHSHSLSCAPADRPVSLSKEAVLGRNILGPRNLPRSPTGPCLPVVSMADLPSHPHRAFVHMPLLLNRILYWQEPTAAGIDNGQQDYPFRIGT